MAFKRQVEGARNFPLFDRSSLEARPQDCAAGFETFDPLNLQRRPNVASLQRVTVHFMPDLTNQFDRVVDVHAERNRNAENRIAEFPRVVLDAFDLAERNGVDDAIDIPQAHRADGQTFDRAQMPADVDVVVDGQRVFDDDEQAGDQIRHQ